MEQTPLAEPEVEERSAWKDSLSHVFRERAFFYIMVAILLVLTLILVWPFLSAILFGFAAVVLTKPLFDWFMGKKWVRSRPTWSVVLTIISAILLIAIPVFLFLSIAVSQATAVVEGLTASTERLSFAEIQNDINSLINEIASGDTTGLSKDAIETWRLGMKDDVQNWIGNVIVTIGQSIPALIINTVIVLALMMVLLPIYRQPDRNSLADAVPFPSTITTLYLDKVQMMMRAMFMGTFIIAFAQGAAMGVVYWIAGVPSSVFLALLSMVLALLPVIGVSLVAWPVAILLFLAGDVWQAIFVIFMLIVVVGNIDAILRPMLVPKDAHLNPALTLLSIFGGLKLLGLVGILYGPVIMILLVTSIEVYTKYILRSDLEPYLDDEGSLSLEKLGLRSEEGETEKATSGIGAIANRTLGRLLSHISNEEESNNQST